MDTNRSGSFSYIFSGIWHIHHTSLLNSDSGWVCHASFCKQKSQAIGKKSVVESRGGGRRSYATILSYTFSQSGVAISPSASLKSVTVSCSPPLQTNMSAPPFSVDWSSPSPLTITSSPGPVQTYVTNEICSMLSAPQNSLWLVNYFHNHSKHRTIIGKAINMVIGGSKEGITVAFIDPRTNSPLRTNEGKQCNYRVS